MAINEQTESAQDDFLDDPWLTPGFDQAFLSDTQKSAFRKKFNIGQNRKIDPFDRPPAPDDSNILVGQLNALMRDSEVRDELSKRNPAWRSTYKANIIEETIAQFRAKHRDYLRTAKNAAELTHYLVETYLGGKDWLDDDAAASELFEAGKWSVETLEEAYAACTADGLLDVRVGTVRNLSQRDQLEVIATAQTEGQGAAVVRYLDFALSGRFPNDGSSLAAINRFRAENPEVINDAVLFVWRSTRAESLPEGDFEQFKLELLQAHPLLTTSLVEDFYQSWRKPYRRTPLFPNGLEPENLDDLSDDEIAERLRQATIASRKSRQ
jgi:hypothetical protein